MKTEIVLEDLIRQIKSFLRRETSFANLKKAVKEAEKCLEKDKQ